MGSVYHDEALEFLTALSKEKPDKDAFVATFNETYLGWQGDHIGSKGYLTSHHHASLIVGRCLHDSLPVPFNTVPYKPLEQHGMATVMAYVSTASEKDVAGLIDRAIKDCIKVMGG